MTALELLEPPPCQGFEHVRDGAVIEAPFALFDEEREMVFGDAVIAARMTSPMSVLI
jgi:hypothetical protein